MTLSCGPCRPKARPVGQTPHARQTNLCRSRLGAEVLSMLSQRGSLLKGLSLPVTLSHRPFTEQPHSELAIQNRGAGVTRVTPQPHTQHAATHGLGTWAP